MLTLDTTFHDKISLEVKERFLDSELQSFLDNSASRSTYHIYRGAVIILWDLEERNMAFKKGLA